jgi:hypothetical protein
MVNAKEYHKYYRKENILKGRNASQMVLMLVAEGMPLKDAKNHIFTLWERGELSFLKLEQGRRKIESGRMQMSDGSRDYFYGVSFS